jgi:hypothetical protein
VFHFIDFTGLFGRASAFAPVFKVCPVGFNLCVVELGCLYYEQALDDVLKRTLKSK